MAIWYLMRASGLVALGLFSVTVVLGIVNAGRKPASRRSDAVIGMVHRNASLLAVVFLALHVTTAILDTYVSISWPAIVVPWLSGYRALWVGLGAVAFDLMLAVVITSLIRVRIGRRAWRAVHWFAYAIWPLAVSHAIGSGTDTGRWWTTSLYAATAAAVGIAAVVRLVGARHQDRQGGKPRIATRGPARPRPLVRSSS